MIHPLKIHPNNTLGRRGNIYGFSVLSETAHMPTFEVLNPHDRISSAFASGIFFSPWNYILKIIT